MEKTEFPELADGIKEIESKTSPEIDKFNPEVKDGIFGDLRQITERGCLERVFIFDEDDVLPSGRYRIDLTADEAKEYFEVARRFLIKPGDYKCFAEALSPELESLVCGGKPGRYNKVKREPWYKRLREQK